MKWMIALAMMLFSTVAFAQSPMKRATDHRLPDRDLGVAPLSISQFGGSDARDSVNVKKSRSFEEYRFNAAKFVTTDGREPIKVRITLPPGMPVYLDDVYMQFEGKKWKPVKATADGVDVTKKLSSRDEQCTCFQDLVIEFPPTGKPDISEATIVFTAAGGERATIEPGKRQDTGPKVYQAGKYYNYEPGSKRGIIEYDGTISPKDELGKPSFKEYVETVQGGKKEPLMVWVRDDGSNLYVVLEVVGDTSVNDVDDKTILYVRGAGPLKSFVAGHGGGAYGTMGTAYTASSDLEHRVYEFRIPFAELPPLDAKGKWGVSFAVTM